MSNVSELHQVAYHKCSTMRDLLRSLTKNKGMSELLVFLSKLLISSVFAYFFEKNQQFPEKTDERIPNPNFNKQKEEENILTG